MVAPINFIYALVLAAAGCAHAYRSNATALSMVTTNSSNSPVKSLIAANEAIRNLHEAYKINTPMASYVEERSEEILYVVCRKAKKNNECRQQVKVYLDRCRESKCFELDFESFPKDKEYQPLFLPDPYQLETAFYLLKNCETDPTANEIDCIFANFIGAKKCSAYHNFLLNLALRNKTQLEALNSEQYGTVEAFINKYVLMATLFYKVYTELDVNYARIMNKLPFSRHFFNAKIHDYLTSFIKVNLPEDFGKCNAARLRHVMNGYDEYMKTQIPVFPRFAKTFAGMVTKTLVRCVSHYQKIPWYRKLYGLLTGFFKKVKEPTVEFFNEKIPYPIKVIAKGTTNRLRKVGKAAKARIKKVGNAALKHFMIPDNPEEEDEEGGLGKTDVTNIAEMDDVDGP
ncbi:rhoptry-associated protein 1 like protein [Babesia gibsoni]|uniref:Rhoptry-associated protein 1 like protein n=1 Tax=Babesia gibsoni TaxID=33632 RepID=A0AAD8LM79_BABGI|nr:rhoptry-associated protein 1 like protein [Babesia gibsoni]